MKSYNYIQISSIASDTFSDKLFNFFSFFRIDLSEDKIYELISIH